MSEREYLDWQSQLHEEDLLKIVYDPLDEEALLNIDSDPKRVGGLERVDPESKIRLLSIVSSLRNVEREETLRKLVRARRTSQELRRHQPSDHPRERSVRGWLCTISKEPGLVGVPRRQDQGQVQRNNRHSRSDS